MTRTATTPSLTRQMLTTEVVIFASRLCDANGFPVEQPRGATYDDVAALVAAGWVSLGERYEVRDGVPAFITTLTREVEDD